MTKERDKKETQEKGTQKKEIRKSDTQGKEKAIREEKQKSFSEENQAPEDGKSAGRGRANRKALFGVLALVAVVGILSAVFFLFREKPVEGSKHITIEVINQFQDRAVYALGTDAEYLRQAMEETEGLTFAGTEGAYGMMVETVNGETANYNLDGAYWSFYVNGGYCNYGIDTQPVEDGDRFSIVYTVSAAE